ncbi:hypothetical protein T265_08448 [Opisthorchis viverrini]|uniref:Uncharacterized protein n=1 Tax=Opisthorchis viverrini TaxID=6198 RepID=A0A074Z9E5_OPIVI|nr:hypothetical protein T265_08448 [Opisthorchis viverrini]KER23723.1 hypothetical protein T265_08448 [Opisthorchis viverrini]
MTVFQNVSVYLYNERCSCPRCDINSWAAFSFKVLSMLSMSGSAFWIIFNGKWVAQILRYGWLGVGRVYTDQLSKVALQWPANIHPCPYYLTLSGQWSFRTKVEQDIAETQGTVWKLFTKSTQLIFGFKGQTNAVSLGAYQTTTPVCKKCRTFFLRYRIYGFVQVKVNAPRRWFIITYVLVRQLDCKVLGSAGPHQYHKEKELVLCRWRLLHALAPSHRIEFEILCPLPSPLEAFRYYRLHHRELNKPPV